MKRLLKKNKQDLAVRTGQTGDTNFVTVLLVENQDNTKLYFQQMGE